MKTLQSTSILFVALTLIACQSSPSKGRNGSMSKRTVYSVDSMTGIFGADDSNSRAANVHYPGGTTKSFKYRGPNPKKRRQVSYWRKRFAKDNAQEKPSLKVLPEPTPVGPNNITRRKAAGTICRIR